jgi:hypothetical protein
VDVGTRNGRVFLCHESYGLLSQIQSDVEDGTVRIRGALQRCLAYTAWRSTIWARRRSRRCA